MEWATSIGVGNIPLRKKHREIVRQLLTRETIPRGEAQHTTKLSILALILTLTILTIQAQLIIQALLIIQVRLTLQGS